MIEVGCHVTAETLFDPGEAETGGDVHIGVVRGCIALDFTEDRRLAVLKDTVDRPSLSLLRRLFGNHDRRNHEDECSNDCGEKDRDEPAKEELRFPLHLGGDGSHCTAILATALNARNFRHSIVNLLLFLLVGRIVVERII